MAKYHNFDIVFAEIPDETTLAINITGCPYRCEGCHSPHLRLDAGTPLDDGELEALTDRYGSAVTCVCFMGGDAEPREIERLARLVRRLHPELRTGWYSGREEMPAEIDPASFDYIKLGGYDRSRGALTSPTTNQRLYAVNRDGSLSDITCKFRR